jgi:hypothetical protein
MAASAMTAPAAAAAGFNITNFAGTNELTLVRDTQISGTRLRLTPPVDSRWGASWYTNKQPVAQGFTTIFQFQVSSIEAGEFGADGFALVIQNDAVNALAAGGEDMGYGNYYLTGIRNSLAIEFDMYENDTQADPNPNHVSVQSRGVLENSGHTSSSLGLATPPFSMKDGAVHTALVQYTPGLLQLSLDGASPILSLPVDLDNLLDLDNGRAWVGFTASCGATHETHDILSWTYVAVPEPSSIALSAIGLIALTCARRIRRGL